MPRDLVGGIICPGSAHGESGREEAPYVPEKAPGGARGAEEEAYGARNRTHNQIRRQGAIGSLNDGVEIETHGKPTRLVGQRFQTRSVHA